MPSPSKASPRRTETRRRLVNAAIEAVAEKGFHGATVDDIAERAGFSVGAIYSNFGSKDDLFLAVLAEHVAWALDRVTEMGQAEDPAKAASESMELLVREPEQFLVFIEFWTYAVRRPKLRRNLASRLAEIRKTAVEVMKARNERMGVAPPLPAEVVVPMALALGRGLALEKLVDPEAVSTEQMASLLSGLLG